MSNASLKTPQQLNSELTVTIRAFQGFVRACGGRIYGQTPDEYIESIADGLTARELIKKLDHESRVLWLETALQGS